MLFITETDCDAVKPDPFLTGKYSIPLTAGPSLNSESES